MKKSVILIGMILLCYVRTYSQNNVFAFFEYDIRSGMEDPFINGYAKDLEWHQLQGDDWSWIGWFVMNGNRRGRFIDATPAHAWKDFDHWKVDAAENARYNKIHWQSYVVNPSGSYREILEEFSTFGKNWYRNRYLQVYYVQVRHGRERTFTRFLAGIKPLLEKRLQGRPFVWMKTISGGSPDTYLLFVALDKIEDLKSCDGLLERYPPADKEEGYGEMIKKVTSELWSYNKKLSSVPEGN
ncbi:hypothetical protein [Sinomicrobium weinanense]|uniref:Uncharacterized protein n=1 Tax=Sinomicrobium weinanense TaxID=2842200 RepID=A0A926Q2L0_9FLAO|nr:hypothetical protein [Sinomicrobium weinanense]MBC9795041.1 hypothetical protein [Sinomicrobium weinanense]MBU3123830.1 hypothetical protein [Sinomicrobium weinanense]